MGSDEQKKSSGEWALPGDILSTAEEYVPGKFTEDSQGKIVSLASGRVKRDEENLVISVEPTKKRVRARNGDVAYGQIIKIDGRHDTVRIGALCGSDGILKEVNIDANLRSPGQRGRGRESGNGNMFRVGDLIRGKFTRVSPYFEVGVMGVHYGVVKSLCSRCRKPLIVKDGSLYCDNCERTEMRKMADDYGNIVQFGDADER